MTQRAVEPVETMNRMDLMREVAEYRRIVPALKAVARAARKAPHITSCDSEFGDKCDCMRRDLGRALNRLASIQR